MGMGSLIVGLIFNRIYRLPGVGQVWLEWRQDSCRLDVWREAGAIFAQIGRAYFVADRGESWAGQHLPTPADVANV